MSTSWENEDDEDDEKWRDENNKNEFIYDLDFYFGSFIRGLTYKIIEPNAYNCLKVIRMNGLIPELDLKKWFKFKFYKGIYVGHPRDFDWLPEIVGKFRTMKNDFGVGLFVGKPQNGKNDYLFWVAYKELKDGDPSFIEDYSPD